MTRTRLFAIMSLAGLAAACGGGKGTTAPGLGDGGTTYTPTTSTQQFFDQVIDASCTAAVRCGTFANMTDCKQMYGSNFVTFDSTAYAIDQGRATLNVSGEVACIQAIANRPCSADKASADAMSAACQNALLGNIAAGSDCIGDFECKPGLECDQGSCTGSCCPGVCATPKPLVGVGGSCASDSKCVDTTYCRLSYNSTTRTYDGICQARAVVGATCAGYGTCVTSAECVGTYGSETCVALAKDGAPCASSGVSCENLASYCDPVKGTCQPRLKENAACVLPDAGVNASFGAGCQGLTQCKNGVCKRLPMEGQACSNPDAAMLDECYLVGKCVNGFCQADPPQPVCTVAVAKATTADAGARD